MKQKKILQVLFCLIGILTVDSACRRSISISGSGTSSGSGNGSGTGSGTSSSPITATAGYPTQQQSKLVGTGSIGTNPSQGYSVSLSDDGNTALVGGIYDNSHTGAAWVFTRSGTTWSQQGSKLVGTGATGSAQQGRSVALSGDGNTAIVGGSNDNGSTGTAWVFTRSGTTWSQQTKLVGTGATGAATQGWSVAVSYDGNTALVGGPDDNGGTGAAWVFARSGTTWSQQTKLVGTGNIGTSNQGYFVALSGDGNTAIVSGHLDDSNKGAVWVFTRSGSTWSQQTKLVGTGATGAAFQGYSVALSADGSTAIVGGYGDDTFKGATWIFTRSATTWSQQTKLIGTGATGAAMQGNSVALSVDGNTAIVGGYLDDGATGAAWVFNRSGTTWSQKSKLVGTGVSGGGSSAAQGWSVAVSYDGNTALVGGVDDDGSIGATWVFVQ